MYQRHDSYDPDGACCNHRIDLKSAKTSTTGAKFAEFATQKKNYTDPLEKITLLNSYSANRSAIVDRNMMGCLTRDQQTAR